MQVNSLLWTSNPNDSSMICEHFSSHLLRFIQRGPSRHGGRGIANSFSMVGRGEGEGYAGHGMSGVGGGTAKERVVLPAQDLCKGNIGATPREPRQQ